MNHDDDLARYARHLNLPGVGPAGQARLAAGEAAVRSRDLAGFVARRYLEAAGVGRVVAAAADPPADDRPAADPAAADAAAAGPARPGAWVDGAVTEPGCRAVVAGAVEALAAMRALLDGDGT